MFKTKYPVSLGCLLCVWNPLQTILALAGPMVQFSRSPEQPQVENPRCTKTWSAQRHPTSALALVPQLFWPNFGCKGSPLVPLCPNQGSHTFWPTQRRGDTAHAKLCPNIVFIKAHMIWAQQIHGPLCRQQHKVAERAPLHWSCFPIYKFNPSPLFTSLALHFDPSLFSLFFTSSEDFPTLSKPSQASRVKGLWAPRYLSQESIEVKVSPLLRCTYLL